MQQIIAPLFFFMLLASALSSSAQLVNIESARMQSDTVGWMGNANAGVALGQSVDRLFATKVGAHIQYKTKKNTGLWLLLSSYAFVRNGGNKYVDNSFLHLRYNYKVNTWLRWEIFGQAQNNLITQLRARILIGTGPRFKIISNDIFKLYAAILIMHEKEKEDTHPSIKHNDMRNSSYVSFTFTPTKNIEIISSTYYQPLFKKISDFRVLNEATLKVKASEHFALSMNWDYLHDRFPAGSSPRTTYNFGSGISFEF